MTESRVNPGYELADAKLGPLVVFGIASVVYWRLSGDVRVYAWV